MRPRRVQFAVNFDKAFRDLPDLQGQIRETIRHFINRTAENALQPERKAGLRGIWAFRVTSGVRVFYTQGKDAQGTYSELFHVGPHDDYRTIERRRPRR
jgi:mRNA-degrading endonuclease RelE of RelBE toxin-antitoxin system